MLPLLHQVVPCSQVFSYDVLNESVNYIKIFLTLEYW